MRGILGAAVRDVTPAGYLALLTYGTAAGPRQDLFQVTLNQGRLRAVELLR